MRPFILMDGNANKNASLWGECHEQMYISMELVLELRLRYVFGVDRRFLS